MESSLLLAYCAMQLKIKNIHGLNVQRNYVYTQEYLPQLKERLRESEATYTFSLNFFFFHFVLTFFVHASAFLFMLHNFLQCLFCNLLIYIYIYIYIYYAYMHIYIYIYYIYIYIYIYSEILACRIISVSPLEVSLTSTMAVFGHEEDRFTTNAH